MALLYAVPPGTIVLCDYNTGFMPPEMVKRRPALVVSPWLAHRDDLCTVVPLSQSAPSRTVSYQCLITLEQPLPYPFPYATFWAKADMLATVGFRRLDLFRTERDQYGKRKYVQPKVSEEGLNRVRHCIKIALGLPP